MDKLPTCPRCGLGKDSDSDGDCPVCAHWDAGRDVIPAILKLLRKAREAKKP